MASPLAAHMAPMTMRSISRKLYERGVSSLVDVDRRGIVQEEQGYMELMRELDTERAAMLRLPEHEERPPPSFNSLLFGGGEQKLCTTDTTCLMGLNQRTLLMPVVMPATGLSE